MRLLQCLIHTQRLRNVCVPSRSTSHWHTKGCYNAEKWPSHSDFPPVLHQIATAPIAFSYPLDALGASTTWSATLLFGGCRKERLPDFLQSIETSTRPIQPLGFGGKFQSVSFKNNKWRKQRFFPTPPEFPSYASRIFFLRLPDFQPAPLEFHACNFLPTKWHIPIFLFPASPLYLLLHVLFTRLFAIKNCHRAIHIACGRNLYEKIQTISLSEGITDSSFSVAKLVHWQHPTKLFLYFLQKNRIKHRNYRPHPILKVLQKERGSILLCTQRINKA